MATIDARPGQANAIDSITFSDGKWIKVQNGEILVSDSTGSFSLGVSTEQTIENTIRALILVKKLLI